MSSLNEVNLIGNVGQDPEVLTTQSGTKLAKFSIATNRRWKDSQGNLQEKTTWHRITVWYDGLINVVEQYVNSGDRLYVKGRIEYDEYEDRGGTKVRAAGIVGEKIILLSSKKDSQGRRRTSAPSSHAQAPPGPQRPSPGAPAAPPPPSMAPPPPSAPAPPPPSGPAPPAGTPPAPGSPAASGGSIDDLPF